jgi:polyhydroxyalkanoate synthesis regulator phasin
MNIQKSLKQKVMASVLAGTAAAILMAAPFMPVSANDSNNAQPSAYTESADGGQHKAPINRHNFFNEKLTKMVNAGTITQDQADKLKAAMKEHKDQVKADHDAWMKSLPDKTGISEQTLKQIFAHPKRHMDPQKMQKRMTKLVQDGKITQTEADSIQNFFKNHKPDQNKQKGERPDPQQMLQTMSSETGISSDRLQEIQHMMMPQRQNHKAMMDQMVKDGKMTQDEETAIQTYFKNNKPNFKKGERPDKDQMLKDMSQGTGISTDRLQSIMEAMHPQGPKPEAPQD